MVSKLTRNECSFPVSVRTLKSILTIFFIVVKNIFRCNQNYAYLLQKYNRKKYTFYDHHLFVNFEIRRNMIHKYNFGLISKCPL